MGRPIGFSRLDPVTAKPDISGAWSELRTQEDLPDG